MSDSALYALAKHAGLARHWTDYRGKRHEVGADTLRRLLAALELPCDSPGELAESRARVEERRRSSHLPPLLTARCGLFTPLPAEGIAPGAAFRVHQDDGSTLDGRLPEHGDRAALPPLHTPGYHRLEVGGRSCTLAVAPEHCTRVEERCGSEDARPWGLSAQLYGLRRPGDGGIGSYTALGELARRLAGDGASALAISPVHAMYAAWPGHCSPYSPSSRLLLNVLYIDPRDAFGAAAHAAGEALGLGEALARAEADTLIDWPQAGPARLAVLHHLFDRALDGMPALQREFEQFRAQQGDVLEHHARFEALHAHFAAQALGGWHDWPDPYRSPDDPAVARFAREHADTVRFHAFLQWLAARGLARAQRESLEAGMPIGLIADLAVGSDPGGSHVWSRQREMLSRVSVGAPPDELARQGQVWGLAALSPTALRETGFHAFIELLRASMQHAGGVRIDHVMGLMRLWLVPEGASALEGAYLHYPVNDMLRLVALESWRHRCVVIGEDLGTVPEGFDRTLADHGLLGMSVLWFERDRHRRFKPADAWRRQAIAMTTTHDLPTAAGWWLGRDIEVWRELGVIETDEALAEQQAERAQNREALWRTLHDGVVALPEPASGATAEFVDAAVAHVGRTPAALAVVPLEDILGLTDAPNVPGTRDEHPNWRRRLPADQELLLDSRPARHRLQALHRARQGPTRPPPLHAQRPDASASP